MSMTTLTTQLGAELKILDVIRREREMARLASNSSYYARLLTASNGYSTSDNEENAAYGSALNHFLKTMVPESVAKFTTYRALLEQPSHLFGVIASEISASKEDIDAGAIEYEYEDNDGEITIVNRKGILGALARYMEGSGHYVTANSVSNGGLTAASGNQGTLTATSVACHSHTPTGVFTIECTDDDVTAPKFKVSLAIATGSVLGGGEETLDADQGHDLTAEKGFTDGVLGCNAWVLTRSGLSSPTESGDNNALFSSWAVSTPKSGDCDEGRFYIRIQRQESDTWRIWVFSDSARTTIVGFPITAPTGTSGTAAVSITCTNGTVITVTLDKAAAHAALASVGDNDDDIYIDIATPRIGDKWTLSVTNDEAGNFSTKIMKAWRVRLPTSGSSAVTDSLAASVTIP